MHKTVQNGPREKRLSGVFAAPRLTYSHRLWYKRTTNGSCSVFFLAEDKYEGIDLNIILASLHLYFSFTLLEIVKTCNQGNM